MKGPAFSDEGAADNQHSPNKNRTVQPICTVRFRIIRYSPYSRLNISLSNGAFLFGQPFLGQIIQEAKCFSLT